MIKRILIILQFVWISVPMVAQSGYKIAPTAGVNTEKDEIACGMMNDKLIVITSREKDYINESSWNQRPVFCISTMTRGEDFSKWSSKEKLFSRRNFADEGPAAFDYRDSTLYFSTAERHGKAAGNWLKIYKTKFDGQEWSDPEVLPFCSSDADYAHPTFDAERNLLVFSSSRSGGYGMMDIWYSYKTPSGWSEPVNPGANVNSKMNELFPTVYAGDIYYSTNVPGGKGGYDLRKANGKQQWNTSTLLDEPFNSAGDDMMLFFINDEKMLLTSNRKGGKGGDDIYVIEKEPEEYELQNFTARLDCQGIPKENVHVKITNAWNETVVESNTGLKGILNIQPLLMNRKYKAQLSGIDPSLYTECVLYIIDSDGNTVKEFRFNSSGFVILEMLPLSYRNLNLLAVEDNSMLLPEPEEPTSVLNIQIEGQLYEAKPGDIGRGEPITILDEKGFPAAIAFTNETGKFRFTDVTPHTQYSFKLAESSSAKHVLIMDRGSKITIPILDAEVRYQRLKANESIELVNEFNETIFVSPEDVYVINRIYYEYNSARLTPESKMQLDKLEILLVKNNELNIELRSHTDARGSKEYNLELSQKRAEAAVSYLVGKGIAKTRFHANGLGESMLLNECEGDVPCSEPEHAINRRTEIRLFEE